MIRINYEGRLGNNIFQYCKALCSSISSGVSIANPLATKIVKYKAPPAKEGTVSVQSGYFQDLDTISQFKAHKDLLFNTVESFDGLFVHVRLGDITNNFAADIDYYRKAIDSVKASANCKKYIASDSPNHPIVQTLIKEYGLSLFNASPEDTILFASSFNRKVLSLGTFSWWIGFLGDSDYIVAPDPAKHTRWHGEIFENMGWKLL